MSLYFPAILLTILANLGYHLCTKKMDPQANPLLSLAGTYLTAFILSALLIPLGGWKGGWSEQVARLNWTSMGLGMSIVALEMGFILAYRSGWTISTAALYSNVAVGIVLLPIGLVFFAESLSISQIAGIAFALTGLVLLSR